METNRYLYSGKRLLLCLAAIVGGLAQPQSALADFTNTGEWDNGDDLRAIRRATAGAGGVEDIPEPPVLEDGASSIHGELRAQSLMAKQQAKLTAMCFGALLAMCLINRVRLT